MFFRFLGFLFGVGTLIFLAIAAGAAYMLWHYGRDLPDYTALQNYEPPVMSRVHAGDGSLLGEYAHERRLYMPIQTIPRLVVNAFVAAEDKNFYIHPGVDYEGVARAGLRYFQSLGSGRRPEGASTITQQVAKNFLLSNEVSFTRKIREALVAMRMETTYSKDKILELYLNDIFLGLNAYGVAAASLVYFDKSVHELTLPEIAYLAALPKGPNNYNPFRYREKAQERRNYVLERMTEDGHITRDQADEAKKVPLEVSQRERNQRTFAADYFTEEVRRELVDKYGEKKLYEGGLSVRTTIDPRLQVMARKVLLDSLIRFDRERGWRGPVQKINILAGEWGKQLAAIPALVDVAPWRLAVVLEASAAQVRVGFQPNKARSGEVGSERETGIIPAAQMQWATSRKGSPLSAGDVIYVEPVGEQKGVYALRQVPEIEGGMVVMDPYTGRVLAMVGGFSFSASVFNRATQAFRQPGSSFKPVVYAAALDNGYSPASVVLDAHFEMDQGAGQGIWKPENYSGKFYGPSTLRLGIELSRNVMTVRLAQDMGMPLVAEYARRFGIYDDMPQVLSMSLGAGETTVLRMTSAYSMFANGGRKIRPTLIDRIQDRYGKTIFRHDERQCLGCNADLWSNQKEPELLDKREQVIDEMTAYQITSMMEGVVQRGTGIAVKAVGKPLAGKTGTTNDEKDAWFVGFSPELAVGVYLGYDKPRAMGKGMTGGALSAPVFRDFMKLALADKPPVPFRVPPGITLIRIDARTGLRTTSTGKGVINEAFKPGQSPPDSYSIIGYSGGDGAAAPAAERDRAVGSGTGGLY